MQWIDDQQPMFALAYWGPDDIHSLRDESGLAPWSDGEAEDWLADNEKKLQASPEYMAQLELFTEQDFDTMEHPEDSDGTSRGFTD